MARSFCCVKHFLLPLIILSFPATVRADLIFGQNLITNGNAESGPSGGNGYNTLASDIVGWTVTDAVQMVRYEIGGGFPTDSSPGPMNRGNRFFAGGPENAQSRLEQTIDLSTGAGQIDAGSVGFDLSAWLGGYNTQVDNARVRARFLNGSNSLISSALIGPVSNEDRSYVTGFEQVSTDGVIPVGTRSVEIVVTFNRDETSVVGYNDGYADNIRFSLTAVPEPSSVIMLSAALAGFAGRWRLRVPDGCSSV